MNESIGQIIKRLRKERNLTQEDLAELLNISAPAVSKWENDTSMPDISQIVPLSGVFGVTTDMLFGVQDISDDETVEGILREAYKTQNDPLEKEDMFHRYEILQEGLKRYPNNIRLLVNCLECGNTISYPENGYCDAERGKEIYQECVRMANLIISYDKDGNEVLRAHMIMALLHSAYGNETEAKAHAEQCPWRSDMTAPVMYAYIAHNKKDYKTERKFGEWAFLYNLESMIDCVVQIGNAYEKLGEHEDALQCYATVFKLLELFFGDEPTLPSIHRRDGGDVYALIAEAYLNSGRKDEALDALEKMAKYDLETTALPEYRDNQTLRTPLMKHIPAPFSYYPNTINHAARLQNKLNATAFDSLRDDPRFQKLLNRIQ